MTTFWKLNFDLLIPTTGSGGGVSGWGSAGKIVATMLLHSGFILMWYATWPCSEKVEFWNLIPITGSGGEYDWAIRGLRAKYLLQCCCIERFPIIWYAAQSCSKSWILTYWPHRQGQGRGSAGKIFAAVLLYIWFFNLICNMTIFWIIKFWPTDPIPRVGGGGRCLRTK